MREIKFRAWDKISGKLIDEGFHILGESTAFDLVMGWMRDKHKKPTLDLLNFVLVEEYTGLKDKNGVEIYEGDVLKGELFGPGVVRLGDYTYEFAGANDMNDEMTLYGWYVEERHNECPINLSCFDEVIGNIHENPELLKG